jgi:hypothetical protein
MQRTFSPSEAALSVFELAKRQPQFVLRFCIIFAVVMMVTNALAGAFGVGTALYNYVALTAGGKIPDPDRVVAVLTPATTGLTIVLLFSLVAGVFTSAMGLRKAVLDEDHGLFGLQFGRDEVRLFVGMLSVGAILFLINIGVSVIGGALTMGNRGLLLLVILVSLVVMTAIGMRFSQFGVLTIANANIGVLPSWQETKGQVWRLIGAYVLWAVIAGVIGVLAQAIATLAGSALGATIGSGLPGTLQEFLTPGWLCYSLIYGLASGFGNLGAICIGAYAWHQMRGDLPAPTTPI